MKENMITIPEMIDLAHSYYLIIGSKNATREAIIRDLKRQKVFDKNVVKNGKKVTHYFDQNTVNKTLYINLRDYFSKRAGRAWQRAMELNSDFEQNPPEPDEDIPIYKYIENDFQKKLNDVMLAALFNKFFTINKERLKRDLLSVQISTEGEYSPAQAAAYDRTVTIEAIIENYVTEK